MKLSEQNLVQDEIRILNEEIDRVVLILHQLTAFSEERTPKIEPVDLNGLLSDLVKLTKDHFMEGAGIQIHSDLDPSLPMVMTEKNGLKQVCINLLKNAAEAMAQGGNLFIQTKYLPPFEEASFEGGQKGFVEICFRDDGPGIPDEIKAKLFEPFVSSKGGAHTGLGLSIVYNIIRTLNGRIACDSEKGSGTTFKIELPIDANSNK
jgi:signal transduction histidine kinase